MLESDYSVVSTGTERANLINLPNTGTDESGFPFFPGYCGVGRVILAGKDVTNLKIGDRTIITWGGHRSHTVKKADSVLKIDFYKHVHRRGISLVGAHAFTRAKQESAPGRWTEHDDYRTFLKLVAAGKLQIRPLISEIVSPDTAHAVYARIAGTRSPPLGIVFDWSKIR